MRTLVTAPELARFRDEPPQMPSGAVGKNGLLRLRFERRGVRTALTTIDRRTPLIAQQALYYDAAMPDLPCVMMIATSGGPDQLTATFAALADPTRRAILARLSSGEASVTELAAPFEMSLPAISKHLKVLERAGLIARGREAQWRPCRLEAAPLQGVADWVGHYRQFYTESLDRLESYLREVQDREDEGKT